MPEPEVCGDGALGGREGTGGQSAAAGCGVRRMHHQWFPVCVESLPVGGLVGAGGVVAVGQAQKPRLGLRVVPVLTSEAVCLRY